MNAAELWGALDRHLPQAYQLRQHLHRFPEVSGNESKTRERVLASFPEGLEVTTVADTGAVARLGGPGPSIGIRGELDALPVREETGVPWASSHRGVMHACGHDVHLAALSAVMHAVAEEEGPYPLLAVLQPREETYPSGAADIAQSGILDRGDCRAMIGAHAQPTLASGVLACVPGGVNAASDEFTVDVNGSSGHAAYPHLTEDPLLAAAEIVLSLQSVVSRGVDPMRSAALSVSSFRSGDAANVVPHNAQIKGILRALDNDTRILLRKRLHAMAPAIAKAHECDAEVTITSGEPVLYNDPALVQHTQALLQDQGFEVSDTLRSLGADDFSFFAETIPSLMLFVGTTTDKRLHSATFLPDNNDIRAIAQAMMAGYLGAAASISSANNRHTSPRMQVSGSTGS